MALARHGPCTPQQLADACSPPLHERWVREWLLHQVRHVWVWVWVPSVGVQRCELQLLLFSFCTVCVVWINDTPDAWRACPRAWFRRAGRGGGLGTPSSGGALLARQRSIANTPQQPKFNKLLRVASSHTN